VSAVAFLRALNVGSNTIRPTELAASLRPWPTTSIGAAGTFVVHGEPSPSKIRNEIIRRLPFSTKVMVVPGGAVLRLLRSRPFGPEGTNPEFRRYVSILERPPRILPRLPLDRPATSSWEVRLTGVVGPFAFSLRHRRQGQLGLYSNEVVERVLGVAATTRGWETLERVGSALQSGSAEGAAPKSRAETTRRRPAI
jgi:uncharacterized protein (DUF1697 family)